MPNSYVIKNQQGVYFLTFQIVSWLVPIAIGITRKRYRDIVIDAFNYCVATKGLRVHAWCIMSNHVHCILSSANGTLSDTIRDVKRHTAKQILLSVQSEPESRRDWLLQGFRQAATAHVRNKDYQVWTHEMYTKINALTYCERVIDFCTFYVTKTQTNRFTEKSCGRY